MSADCDLDVNPGSLAFGSVLIGNTSSLDVVLDNTGFGDREVYGLDITGSSDFYVNPFAPAVPFTVPAGSEPVSIKIDYAPGELGDDAGSLNVSSEDPDTPLQSVSLSGSGVFSMVDLDIAKLKASHRVSLSGGRAISRWTRLVNTGLDDGDRLVRLTGVQGGSTIYTHERLAGDPVSGGGTRVNFPSYTPSAAGLIIWTLVIFDDDPDVDVATANTTVVD